MKQQQGFTLLEVLLVIVIIAMMAAGVIASQNSRLSATGRLSQQAEAFRQQVEYRRLGATGKIRYWSENNA